MEEITLNDLWLFFANLAILYIYIYILFFGFALLHSITCFILQYVLKYKKAKNILHDLLKKYSNYSLHVIYLGLLIYGILMILSYLTNKGIFANSFLGG